MGCLNLEIGVIVESCNTKKFLAILLSKATHSTRAKILYALDARDTFSSIRFQVDNDVSPQYKIELEILEHLIFKCPFAIIGLALMLEDWQTGIKHTLFC